MLHHICQELTRDNVSDFLFLCEHIIASSKREQIKDSRDLLYVLEQLNTVGPGRLHFLSSVLAEIRRHDLAKKVKEHCQMHRIQRLEDDSAVLPNSYSTAGPVAPSATKPPRIGQVSSNEVVTYNHARVLEPDDAVPVILSSQHVSTTEASSAHDPRVVYSVPQPQLDLILRNIDEEMIPGGIPASNVEDMPSYDMKSNPRGNVYTALCKLLLIFYCYCIFISQLIVSSRIASRFSVPNLTLIGALHLVNRAGPNRGASLAQFLQSFLGLWVIL